MAKYCPEKGGPALYTECLECELRGHCGTAPAEERPWRCIIAGTRTFTDYQLVLKTMAEIAASIPKSRIEIISGGASGADKLGELFARRNGLKLTVFPAEWKRYGYSAGPIRNRQMAEYAGKDGTLVAFWDESSRGTLNMIRTAADAGLSCHVISIRPERYGMRLSLSEMEKK